MNRFYKLTLFLLLAIYIISVCSSDVYADMGPKPSITIHVENGPSEYYLALLCSPRGITGTNSDLKLENVNEVTVQNYLKDFFYDEWVFSESPVGDNIISSRDTTEFYFGYMVPDDFKVIIISTDGTVYLSDHINPEEFNADITYDVATGKLTETIEDRTLRHSIYVVVCYLLTLAMELVVLLLFKYPFNKRNLFCFLLINTITNIPFSIFLINQRASIPMIIIWFFLEIIIMLLEGVFYLITLRDAEGRRRKLKSFLYGVVANIASATLGTIILFFYGLIFH